MRRLRYLAYGSNLLPGRLCERVPSARPLGVLELAGWRLAFDKRGRDGSAKCNLHPSAEAGACRVAFGVVYEIRAAERATLDAVEDLGRGYLERRLQTEGFGEIFLYLAAPDFVDATLRPYTWYHDLVTAGARHHGLPQDYVERIARIAAVPDPDPARNAAALRILAG